MVKEYPDFWSIIIGKGPLGSLLAYLVIAVFCAAISALISVANRDISNTSTPNKIVWSFFFAHNIARLLINVLCIPIVIRLVYEYIPDMKLMLFISIGIGFGSDRLALLLKNMGVLTTNKIAQLVADKVASTDVNVTPKQ